MTSPVATAVPDRTLPRWIFVLLGVTAVQQAANWLPDSPLAAHVGLVNSVTLDVLCWFSYGQFRRVARRLDLPEEVRRLLRPVAGAVLLQALDGLVVVALHVLRLLGMGGPAWFNALIVVSDLLGQASEVWIMYFLLRLPSAGRARRGRLRAVVDGLTFIIGAGIPLWLFSLRPLFVASTNVDDLFTAVSPLLSFGGLLILSWALETRAMLPDRRANQLLLVAPAFLLLSGIIFSVGKAGGIDRGLVLRMNFAFLAVAFACWIVAGWRLRVTPPAPMERRPLADFSPLPMITIVAAASLFMVVVLFGRAATELYPKLLGVFFVFLLVLLARESFVIRDSLQLVAIETAQKTRARYEALIRHSTDFVMVVGADQRIGFVSPAAERMLGLAAAALAGRPLLEFVHPDDRPAGEAFLRRLAATAEHTEAIQWRFVAPDGTLRQLETIGNNQLGEPDLAGLVLNSRDVSERQQMEAQLRHSQKMDAIGQLAGGVAHDFNNILTAQQLQLELLRLDHAHDPALRAGLDELKESAVRAAGLTRQLLMFGRRQFVQRKSVELDALLGNLLKMLRRLIGENITIEFLPNNRPAWVTADSGMLEQVVMNLVVNARDAVIAGGRITLATGLAELTADETSRHPEGRAGRFVTIRVADTGHGMAPDTLQRIFEPFFTTKELGHGTGLGLATVYGIVKQHEGWIEVQSEVGRGTTFVVYLPAAAAPGSASPGLRTTAPATGGRESILLVEDDPSVRQLAQTVLRHAGYAVVAANSGPEAVERWQAAERGTFRLLLTDMVMPGGMSGLELVQRLRRDEPGLKVAVMSGYSHELSSTGLSADAHIAFLAKPFESDELLLLVREVIETA